MIYDHKMAEDGENPVVITVPDDPEEDWPDAGPQNITKAECYTEKVNQIFEDLEELLLEDNKDTLLSAIYRLKKLMECHWKQMGDVDVDVVVKAIKDPAYLHLRQHLTPGGMEL